MIDINDQTTSIELIFPTKISLTALKDLSTIISIPKAIPAIFNESWAVTTIGDQGSNTVVHDPAQISTSFAIVNTEDAISETNHDGYDAISISIPDLINRANAVAKNTQQKIERVYVRFRLLEFKRDFYCVGAGHHTDRWWQPSWQRTEDIDFRINVRRGAPPGLEKKIGRFLDFSKVHLFLMRSRDKDIVYQDKLFKASRSLEDEEFWASYSIYGTATTQEATEASLKRVRDSLGYHWKSGGPGPVKEFGTLARFKIVEFGVLNFVAVALIFGAMGNMLWDSVKFGYDKILHSAIVKEQTNNSPEIMRPSARCNKE